MTVPTSILAAIRYRHPFLRPLVNSLGLAQNKRFYDRFGFLIYISSTTLSLLLPIIHARSTAPPIVAAKSAFPTLLGAFTRQASRPY